MNFSYPPPSSSNLRPLKPDYGEEGQFTYSTDTHNGPTFSTDLLKNVQMQLQAAGQREVSGDVDVQSAPELTDVRILEHSGNNININATDYRNVVDPYGGGPGSFSDLLRQKYSGTGITGQYYGGGEPMGLSGFNQRPRSMIGSAVGNAQFGAVPDAKNSLTGPNLRNAYKQFNQFDQTDIDEDLDFDAYIK